MVLTVKGARFVVSKVLFFVLFKLLNSCYRFFMKRIFLSLFLFILSMPSAFADGGEAIHQFDVEINLASDGKVHVLEKILYDFGGAERHGIYRTIPLVYGDNALEIPFELKGVYDENGYAYQYDEIRISDEEIRIGDPDSYVSGEHWYYIEYESAFLTNGFDDHDEFYWNVNGNGWDVPIEEMHVSLTVPSGAKWKDRYATCYAGYYASTDQDCERKVSDDKTYEFSVNGGLLPAQGLTIVAAFEKDLIPLPAFLKINSNSFFTKFSLDGEDKGYVSDGFSRVLEGRYTLGLSAYKYYPQERELDLVAGEKTEVNVNFVEKPIWIFLDTYLPIILFFLFLFLIVKLWWDRGRDPEGRGTIMPFYKPTDDLSPGEMGVLVDERADFRDISASIVQLAVKGYVRIEKKSDKAQDYDFVKLKNLDKDVLPFEQRIFESIFAEGEKVSMKSLEKEFYKSLDVIKADLYDAVVTKAYFDLSPDKVRKSYVWKAFWMCLFVWFLSIGAAIFILSPFYLLLFIPSILTFVVALFMPKKTVLGVEVHERILGYKMFLATAEKGRLEKLFSPKEYADVFEKNLPYAMVLGVEKKWASQFEGLYDAIPTWYVAGGINGLNSFMYDLRHFQTDSQSVYAYNPASSGSSGFGSGGFSGGGFGGGGGGSW